MLACRSVYLRLHKENEKSGEGNLKNEHHCSSKARNEENLREGNGSKQGDHFVFAVPDIAIDKEVMNFSEGHIIILLNQNNVAKNTRRRT